jgi:hypothetical protein
LDDKLLQQSIPSPQVGQRSFTDIPRLFIQYFRSYPPYLEAIALICILTTSLLWRQRTYSTIKRLTKYGRLQTLNLCFRNLPPGIQTDVVFSDMKYLLELLEPNEQNQSKFLQLQSILDYNNITVETVMRRVSCTSTTLHYFSFRVAVFRCSLQSNAQDKRVIRLDLSVCWR